MLTKFPLLFRFCSKLLYELLPAAIASVVGGLLFSHYAKTPVATPAAAMMIPASAEMIQMVRDEHALFIDTLKKYTAERHQADLIAEKEARRTDIVEQAATLATAEPRTAGTKAVAVAAHTAKRAEKSISEKQSTPYLDKAVITEPLQLHPMVGASTQAQRVRPPATPPAGPETPTASSGESGVMATLGTVTATVGKIPAWVGSAGQWFSEVAPPRPPAPLPERSYLRAGL
jgi:hypothetical protein